MREQITYERGKKDMTQNATQANTTIWIFAIILVGWTLVQAALFVRLALRFNKKHQVYSNQELKRCVRTGIIAVIGPGINSMFLAISMMALVGGGLTFLRCGVIGTPAFEMTKNRTRSLKEYLVRSLIQQIFTRRLSGQENLFLAFATASRRLIVKKAEL